MNPHDAAKNAEIRRILPGPGLSIYEASAGTGDLAHQLREEGHRVVISNFRKGTARHALEEHAVDLNGALPFPDGAFDVVICREVIEHVESIPATLREFRRCLRPGGLLALTLPNRLHVRSRLYHLFTCFYRGMKSPINLDVPFGEAHINLVGYPEMDYFMRHAGFQPSEPRTSRIRGADRLLLLLWPVLRAAGWYYLTRHRPHEEEHDKTTPARIAYNRWILRGCTSRAVLVGIDLILFGRKKDGVPPVTTCAPWASQAGGASGGRPVSS